MLRASVTSYMAVTGIVYNMLLRGVNVSEGSVLPWSNEVLHVVGPLLMVIDWLFAPGRRRPIEWKVHLDHRRLPARVGGVHDDPRAAGVQTTWPVCPPGIRTRS